MSEKQWTQEDFVQLARRRMMSIDGNCEMPQRLFEFFAEAFIHYDNATEDGKAYFDKAMSELNKLFEAEPSDLDTPATREVRVSMASLRVLHDAWRNKRFGPALED
jgi:hypothetical protein